MEHSIVSGVLESKLEMYYEDANLINYRKIFNEGFLAYKGKELNKILDIGCGIGTFLESIKPLSITQYGLEASKYGLSRSREKGINCQEFHLQNGNDLPFLDNTFSLVIFNQVIEHLDKDSGKFYIKEIVRVLEPGGVAIIKSPSRYSRIQNTDPHHIYCWKPNELYREVSKYNDQLSSIFLRRVALQPWMLCKYNENIINRWHKRNKHPYLNIIFYIIGKVSDQILYRFIKADVLLANADVTFAKASLNDN